MAFTLPDRLLDYHEAASYLHISHNTLRQWCSRGRIPYVKVGKRTFFAPEDLEAYIVNHRVEAIAEGGRR
ncbi:MAG: helix-turn-helix domain-containing protein [bacterium]